MHMRSLSSMKQLSKDFFEVANAFGFVKNYNGKGITWQVTPTLNSVFRLA